MGSKVPIHPPGEYRCLACRKLITFVEPWSAGSEYCSCGNNTFAAYNVPYWTDDAVAPPPPPAPVYDR